jgi:hypothetical protein
VATGGTTGQVLSKVNATDFNTQWTTPFDQITADGRYVRGRLNTTAGNIDALTGNGYWFFPSGTPITGTFPGAPYVKADPFDLFQSESVAGTRLIQTLRWQSSMWQRYWVVSTWSAWTQISGGGAGSIALDDLTDVVITSPVNQHILMYDGAFSRWVNLVAPWARNLDDLLDVAITTPNTGQTLRYNGTTWVNGRLNLDDLLDVTVASPANGQALLYESASSQWKNVALPSQYTEVDWSSSLVWSGAVAGSGSVKSAFYQRIGNWVELTIYLSFGTTGLNGGTGDLSFNLPFPPAYEQVGTAKTWMPSQAVTYLGICRTFGGSLYPMFTVNQTDSYAFNWRSASAGAAAGTGVPAIPSQYTVQQGGDISLSIRYKI